MTTNRSTSRVLTLAVFLAPLLVVKGAALFFGTAGPERAAAEDTLDETFVANQVEKSAASYQDDLTRIAARRAAAGYGAELKLKGGMKNPLYYPPRETESRPEPTENIQPDPQPQLDLQAIMRLPDGYIARINGTSLRNGDPVDSQKKWVIDEIASRVVTLKNVATGERMTLEMTVEMQQQSDEDDEME